MSTDFSKQQIVMDLDTARTRLTDRLTSHLAGNKSQVNMTRIERAVLALVSDASAYPWVERVMNIHEQTVHIWEVFFALHCVLLGYLIFRSGFVPKVLGLLMILAALGYLANSFGNLVHPQSKAFLASVVAVTAIIGELPFFLWLLIKAVDAEAWQKLAAARR